MTGGGGASPALGAEWELACADGATAARREVDPREPVKPGRDGKGYLHLQVRQQAPRGQVAFQS